VQQEKGGLRGNRQADLVAHDQAAGSLEVLFLDEHAGVTEQLALVCLAQSREDGHAILDNATPVIRKWLGTQALAARLSEQGHVAKLTETGDGELRLVAGCSCWLTLADAGCSNIAESVRL